MDFYETLGITKEATEVEVKKAYRKLAHKFHPDKAGGDSDKFKQITKAYDVLSNRSKRESYDRFGSVDENDIDFEGFEKTMEQSVGMAGFANKKDQQLVKIASLIEQVVAQATGQGNKQITSGLAKELAQRVLNIVYGD